MLSNLSCFSCSDQLLSLTKVSRSPCCYEELLPLKESSCRYLLNLYQLRFLIKSQLFLVSPFFDATFNAVHPSLFWRLMLIPVRISSFILIVSLECASFIKGVHLLWSLSQGSLLANESSVRKVNAMAKTTLSIKTLRTTTFACGWAGFRKLRSLQLLTKGLAWYKITEKHNRFKVHWHPVTFSHFCANRFLVLSWRHEQPCARVESRL